MSDACPRCGLVLATRPPEVGETWLRVDTGKLYMVTMPFGEGSRPYATAERLHPHGQQGCDPSWQCAMWPDQIRSGGWIRVDTTNRTHYPPSQPSSEVKK